MHNITRPKIDLIVKLIIICVIGIGLTASSPVAAETFRSPFQNNLLGQAPQGLADELLGEGCSLPSGVAPAAIGAMLNMIGFQGPEDPVTFNEYQCNALRAAAGEEPLSSNGNQGLGNILINSNYALLEQRPASSVIFALNHYDRLVNPAPVYAEDVDIEPYFPGTGYDLLSPMQSFWGWAVTISLSFMTFIILLVAFAMLFRSRLGGQQVVQIQNAIPSIVLAMLLIPLSYPISGLFIDAITLGTNVFHGFMFSPGGPGRDVWVSGEEPVSIIDEVTGEETQTNPDLIREGTRGLYADDPRLGTFGIIQLVSVRSLGDIGKECYTEGLSSDDTLCQGYGVAGTILKQVESLLGMVNINNGVDSGWLPALIIQLLFTVIAIVTAFRILKRLLIKFLMLILLPVISPFIFATVAIPGRGMKVVNWYTSRMAAASLYYIATYAIFITVIVLSNPAFYNNIPGATSAAYQPPLLAPAISELLSGTAAGNSAMAAFFTLLTAGLFVYTPKLLDSINAMLGVKDGIPEFLKDVGSEFRSSANIGFKQVPATGLGIGREGLRAVSGTAQGGLALVSGGNRAVRGAGDLAANLTGRENYFTSDAAKSRAIQRQSIAENRLANAQKMLKDAETPADRRKARSEIAGAQRHLAGVTRGNTLRGQTVSAADGEKQEMKYKFIQTQTKAEISNNTIRINDNETTLPDYLVTLQITSSQRDMPKGSKIVIKSDGSDIDLKGTQPILMFSKFEAPTASGKPKVAQVENTSSGDLKLVAVIEDAPSTLSSNTKEVEIKLRVTTQHSSAYIADALERGLIYSSPEASVDIVDDKGRPIYSIGKIKLLITNGASRNQRRR